MAMTEVGLMNDQKLLRRSGCWAGFAAVCCFTPFLVLLLPAIGLAAWLAWIDYVLWPMLFVALGFVGYALYLRRRRLRGECACPGDGGATP